jgi:phenylalanyl-tRNA synthetase alpha chain
MPAVRRDLSVAVDESDREEDLGDRVRESLGSDADVVEEVAVISTTAAHDLPADARRRLGIGAGQVNLLVRVSLRALDRTLSADEANDLRDRIYAALHRGSAHMWASRREPAGSLQTAQHVRNHAAPPLQAAGTSSTPMPDDVTA